MADPAALLWLPRQPPLPRNWSLTDASRHTYTFPNFVLGSKKSVKIHTGRGTNTRTDLYQQRRAYVWNNDRDTATLRRPGAAKPVDTCSYVARGGVPYVNC